MNRKRTISNFLRDYTTPEEAFKTYKVEIDECDYFWADKTKKDK